MKLSEMPEGVIVSAKYGNSSANGMFHRGMFHRGGKAYYAEHPDDPSVLPLDEWRVIDGTAHETIATLRTRIAELEAALAKATRPAPAVGQVWRAKDDEVYLIAGGGDAHINMYGDCSVLEFGSIAEAGPMKDCTYVGIWDGVFNVKEVAK